MPGVEFFRHLGLFLIEKFLAEDDCKKLIDLIAVAPKVRGGVIGDHGTLRMDERRRSVDDAQLPPSAVVELKQSFLDLQPDLEAHYKMPLVWGGEGPDYLLYRTGDFFKPHDDVTVYPPDPTSRIARRRVAVVLFLNRHAHEPGEDCFGGGLLRFYGLLNGPQWQDCPLGLEPQPGLLVAFPSRLVHEVTPITFGERYSILTGFHAPAASLQ